jgi:hypothetical protein
MLFFVAVMIVLVWQFFKRTAAAKTALAIANADAGTDPAALWTDSLRRSLFERPTTASPVLRELPEDAVVTYCGAEGGFLRVTTADNVVGYVVASACTPETDTKGQTQ